MFLLIGAVFVFLLMAAAGVGGFFWWKHRQKVALQQARMAQQEAAMAEQQAQEAQPENQPSTTQEQPSQTVEPQAEPSAPTAEPSEQAANPPAEPAPVKKTPKQPKATPPPTETPKPSSTETAQAPVATEPPAEAPKPAIPEAVNLENAFGKPCGNNEQFVTGLYQSVLERQPDQGGMAMWLGKMGSNTTREDIYRQFFSSQEYVARNKSDRQFVRDAYQAVLGREPDEAGMQLMLAKLQKKKTKRVDVINGLLSSAEYKAIMTNCR